MPLLHGGCWDKGKMESKDDKALAIEWEKFDGEIFLSFFARIEEN